MKKHGKISRTLYSIAVVLTCIISIWSFIAPTIEVAKAGYKVDETVNKGFSSGNDLNHQFAVKDGDGYKNMTDLNEMEVGESMYVLFANMSVDHSYVENGTNKDDDLGIAADKKVVSNSRDFTKETYGSDVWYNYNPSKRFLTLPSGGGRAFIERLCSDVVGEKHYSDLEKYMWKVTCHSIDSKGIKNFTITCRGNYLARQSTSKDDFLFALVTDNFDGDRTLWQFEKEYSLPTRNYFEEKEYSKNFSALINNGNERIDSPNLTNNSNFTKFFDNAYAIKSSVDISNGGTLSSYLFHRTYLEWSGGGKKSEMVHDAMMLHQDGGSLGNHTLNYYWLVFPILQDVDKTATYGYSGAPSYQPINQRADVKGITTTISSLYNIADTESDKKDERTGDNITCVGGKEGYGGNPANGYSHEDQRIQNAEYIPAGTTSNNQLMKMTCGSSKETKMTWEISPTSNTGLRLDICGDNKDPDSSGYTPRDGWASRDNTVGFWSENGQSNQFFMFLYSLNSDGGYYILPMCLEADANTGSYFNGDHWKFDTNYERSHYRIQDYGLRVLDYAESNRELQVYDFFAASNQRFWIHCESQSYQTFVLVDVAVDVEKTLRDDGQYRQYTYPLNGFNVPNIIDKNGVKIADNEAKLRQMLKTVVPNDAILDANGNMIETDVAKIKDNVISKVDQNIVYKTIDVSVNDLYYNSKFYEGTEKDGYTFIMDSVHDITNADINDNATFVKRVCIRFYRPNRYTAKYERNGGEGTPPQNTSHVYDHIYQNDLLDTKAFPENTFTKNGYTFVGWNTSADGSGTKYQPGDEFYDAQPPVNINVNLTSEDNVVVPLYAQWERAEFRLVDRGQNIVVKNADSYNIQSTGFINSKLNNFSDGALNASYTYGNASKATFEVTISSYLPVDYCWYVDSDENKQGAKKLGVASVGGNSFDVNFRNTQIRGDLKISNTNKTTLEVSTPTKKHDGLYFFCVIVAKNNNTSFSFPDTIRSGSFTNCNYLEGDSCQLRVANNIVYHSVDKNGNNEAIIAENGQLWEDWIVYGTRDVVEFPQNVNYIQYDDYDSTIKADPNNPAQPLAYSLRTYSYDKVQSGNSGIGFDGWILFEDTVRNPNKSVNTFTNYKNKYAEMYGAPTTKDTTHGFWRLYGAFSMDEDITSVVHDSTINLYTKWYIDLSADDININVFVDKFGTTFIADEESYSDGNIIFADKNSEGENKYIKDIVYVIVSLNGVGDSGGTIQYNDSQRGWIDISGPESIIKDAIKGTYTDRAKLTEIKNWYSSNLEQNCNPSSAVEINTEVLIKKLTGNSEVVCPSSKTSIEFRYVYGASGNNGWFAPLGTCECGEITLIPFNYAQLS